MRLDSALISSVFNRLKFDEILLSSRIVILKYEKIFERFKIFKLPLISPNNK